MRAGPRSASLLNLSAKLLLLALLAYAMANPELPRFAGKAMAARAATYPLAIVLVPIAWAFLGRPRPYPHGVDVLLVSPFLVDVAGNTAASDSPPGTPPPSASGSDRSPTSCGRSSSSC